MAAIVAGVASVIIGAVVIGDVIDCSGSENSWVAGVTACCICVGWLLVWRCVGCLDL